MTKQPARHFRCEPGWLQCFLRVANIAKGPTKSKMLFLQLVFTVIQVSSGVHKVNGMSDFKSWQLDILTFKNVCNGLDQFNSNNYLIVY